MAVSLFLLFLVVNIEANVLEIWSSSWDGLFPSTNKTWIL